jgi:pantoate--beta-alanine ligase
MAAPPEIISGTEELRARIGAWRREGARVALVPTMGALHDGHAALCRIALQEAQRLIVSIFVNPKQFAPHEDLAKYPRPFAADVRLIEGVGAHAVFAPGSDTMYPEGFATHVRVGGTLGADLEARARPDHFEGVATVVSKLLLQVQPDLAVFGEKDYQQLLIVRRLVRDLDLPVEIRAGATVREEDGLALSSRNRYLSPLERRIAPRLHQTLQAAAFALKDGATADEAAAAAKATLEQCGFAVDYVELRDAETLAPVADAGHPARLLAAVRLGATRLIDNVAVQMR